VALRFDAPALKPVQERASSFLAKRWLVCRANLQENFSDGLTVSKEGPMATKKKTAKKSTKKAGAKKANSAFMAALQPSEALSAVVGSKPLPRTEVTKKVWAYIKKHNLQDAKNRRNINADAVLGKIFGAKKTVTMFDLTKLVNKHLSPV
jgi:chromatin remodeling complex protein RSC6